MKTQRTREKPMRAGIKNAIRIAGENRLLLRYARIWCGDKSLRPKPTKLERKIIAGFNEDMLHSLARRFKEYRTGAN